jgi:hypothetical protein
VTYVFKPRAGTRPGESSETPDAPLVGNTSAARVSGEGTMNTKKQTIEPTRIYTMTEAADAVGGRVHYRTLVAALKAGTLRGSDFGGSVGGRCTGRALLDFIDAGGVPPSTGEGGGA